MQILSFNTQRCLSNKKYNLKNGDYESNYCCLNFNFPDESEEVLPGVKWGNYCQLYTPAFWKYLYIYHKSEKEVNKHNIGRSLIEEIVACLLGGYGMPSQIGILAFKRLKEDNLIVREVPIDKILDALSRPLQFPDGTQKKYRFYNQKSKFIASFLKRPDLDRIPLNNDLELRDWLLSVEGIGLKTASWITRNWLKSENVAILDIHILRAGQIAGFFNGIDVTKNYRTLEKKFIDFCTAIDTRPSDMDAIIWDCMKKTNKIAIKLL